MIAVWFTPACPRGEWVLGLECGRLLIDLDYFETQSEALDALDEMEGR
jgi:hypothetical protein